MNWKKLLTPTIVAIFVIIFTSFYANTNRKMWRWDGHIIQWDIKSYYAYLPATFIHGDLTLEFTKSDPVKYIKNYWPGTAPNGAKIIVTSMGMAFLYLPFFLIAHIWALIGGYVADGYSTPYLIMIQFSVLAYLMLGLVLLRKILLKYFTEVATALALLGIGFGTNLFYYSNAEGAMSHGFSFALFAALFYLTIKWWEKPTVRRTVMLGLLSGLIVLIRPTNIVVILVFGLFGVTSLKTLWERILFFIKNWQYVLIIGLCALLVWAPQLIYWKYLTGSWFYYSYGDDANFFWSNPQFINGLFSYRKGWFVYTPIMIFAIVGLYHTFKRHRGFFVPILLFLVANLYVVFSWWNWWYGGGFGQRALIESYAFLIFPFAAFIDAGIRDKSWKRISTIIVVLAFTAHGLFMNFQYYYGSIHWDSMTKEAYWLSFGRLKKHPNLNRHLKRLDYGFARKGVYILEKEPNTIVKEAVFCDMETLDFTGSYFLSTDGSMEFHNGKQQTNEVARSGNHSVRVNGDTPFALNHRFKIKPGDQLEFEIWRHSKSSREAALFFSAQEAKNFYQKADRELKTEKGWGQLSYTLVVPNDYPDSLLVVYVWSPKGETAFFDDYSVKRMGNN